MSAWDLSCYVCLHACVLAHITVTVTFSGSDSCFLGVSSVLPIRGSVASEQNTRLQLLARIQSESIKEASIHALIQVCLLLSRVH